MTKLQQTILELVTNIVGSQQKAQMVLDVLQEEGVLHLEYGNVDVDRITTKFASVFGSTKISKYDRFAAQRLARRYSAQAVCGVIELLAAAGEDKYVPVVNNVVELENKWISIMSFVRKRGQESEVIV